MPDQVQNPNINFPDQGSPPVIPPAPVVGAPEAGTNPGPAAPQSAADWQNAGGQVEPVPLPKVTDVEKPLELAATSAPQVAPVKEEVNPLFEKPETVAPGAKSEQRTANSEQRKLPKGMVAGIASFVFLMIVSVVTGWTLYQRRGEPIAPTAPKLGQAALDSLCANGSFTTSGGHRYCFIGGESITTRSQAQSACQPYGSLASFLDGEIRQNVLDVISRFNLDKSQLNLGTGGNMNDGAYFADFCSQFIGQYGNSDISLYWGDPEGSGHLDCSQQPLSFGRSNENQGRVNDTRDGNGRGAVCELPLPTLVPTVTPTPVTISANCESLAGQMSDGAGGWTSKTDAEFVAVARPGDRVRFMCTGAKTGGNFTKSAFFINGILHVDDVVKLNDTQFAVEHTIGAAGALKVESVLLHDSKGWVD